MSRRRGVKSNKERQRERCGNRPHVDCDFHRTRVGASGDGIEKIRGINEIHMGEPNLRGHR